MPPTRPRRIVKWTAIAVVAPLLLLASYVSAWLAVSNAYYRAQISSTTADHAAIAFRPIVLYCDTDMPGADTLCRVWWRMNSRLHNLPAGAVHRLATLSYIPPLAPRLPRGE